ncbi:hypothetical protein [Sinorhizobium meliloti]|uniref:hypothetical protein n=1 Tax=Rhizobium meliloti TaxID=382 RepID=UPI0013E3F06D|nr:hypothetical protein [Sinorhizobium meliloti]
MYKVVQFDGNAAAMQTFLNDQEAEGYLFVQAVYMTTYKWRLVFRLAADGN